MGYRNNNITTDKHLQKNSDSVSEHVYGNFKSPKGDQLTSNVVQTLIHQGSVINVTTDNDVVSVIINKHDHTSLHCQPVIQNDLWAHPTALNKIVARAVEGKKTDIQYYHKNYLDHVYAVSDKDGDIKEHYRYTAFGEAEIYNTQGQKLAESAIDNTVMWNSRRYDGDTGLYYYKYRHYAAKLGRWLGRDPIEEDGGINLYAFVGNDVVNKWDRLGLNGICGVRATTEVKTKRSATTHTAGMTLLVSAADNKDNSRNCMSGRLLAIKVTANRRGNDDAFTNAAINAFWSVDGVGQAPLCKIKITGNPTEFYDYSSDGVAIALKVIFNSKEDKTIKVTVYASAVLFSPKDGSGGIPKPRPGSHGVGYFPHTPVGQTPTVSAGQETGGVTWDPPVSDDGNKGGVPKHMQLIANLTLSACCPAKN